MAIFGGKPGKSGIPVDEVRNMKAQNIDNNRIIQTLQRDGYSSSQIFEAINISERRPASRGVSSENNDSDEAFGGESMSAFEENQPNQQSQNQQYQSSNSNNSSQVPPNQGSQKPMGSPVSQPNYSEPSNFNHPVNQPSSIPSFNQGPSSAEVEEMIESIIEEKWEDIVDDITKIVEWKNETESKVDSLEHDLNSLRAEFDKLHQAVIGKIGEYDKNILNVGAEVKAMEKVFSKVLPVFTEKVNQLADVSDNLKKKLSK